MVQGAMRLKIRLGNFLGHHESRGENSQTLQLPLHPWPPAHRMDVQVTPGDLSWCSGSPTPRRAPPGEREHPLVSMFFIAGLPLASEALQRRVFRGTVSGVAHVFAPLALGLGDRSIPGLAFTPALCSLWAQ